MFLRSLRSRIVCAMVLLTMLFFGGTMGVTQYLIHIDAQREAINTTGMMKQTSALAVRHHFRFIEDDLKVIVHGASQRVVEPQEMEGDIRSVVMTDPTVKVVAAAYVPGVAIPSGQRLMLHATPDSSVHVTRYTADSTYTYLDKQWYTEAIAGKGEYWSEPYRSSVGDSAMVITYACPIADAGGRVYAVAVADVALTSIRYGLHLIKPYPSSYTLLLTQKGRVVSASDSICRFTTDGQVADIRDLPVMPHVCDSVLTGHDGEMITRIEGMDYMVNYCPLEKTPWTICTLTPYSEVTAGMGVMAYVMLAGALLAMLAMMVCAWLVLNRLFRPLEALALSVGSFADGEFRRPLPELSGTSELDRLASAFKGMQGNLHDYMRRLTEETRYKQNIESELHFAGNIQQSLLPSDFTTVTGVDLHAYFKPAYQVGGDFYDFCMRGRKLCFVIADVSGKGMPAALFMCVARTLFRSASEHIDSAAAIARNMNVHLCKGNDTLMFATAIIGVLDTDTRLLTWCNAGHNPFVMIQPGAPAAFDQRESCLLLGFDPDAVYMEHSMVMPPHSTLLLYTDGLNEAEDMAHGQYGNDRLLRHASTLAGLSAREVIEGMRADLREHTAQAPQSDDVTLMAVRV